MKAKNILETTMLVSGALALGIWNAWFAVVGILAGIFYWLVRRRECSFWSEN